MHAVSSFWDVPPLPVWTQTTVQSVQSLMLLGSARDRRHTGPSDGDRSFHYVVDGLGCGKFAKKAMQAPHGACGRRRKRQLPVSSSAGHELREQCLVSWVIRHEVNVACQITLVEQRADLLAPRHAR